MRFDVEIDGVTFGPRYNIAPTQMVPIIIVEERGRKLEMMRWGLIPSWAKEVAVGNRMINARCETLAEKPAFKRYFKSSRCLVPADGFYEWKKAGTAKQPMRITLKSGQLFAMAGLWARWRDARGQEVHSFSVITTAPNSLMRDIHNRMPAILHPAREIEWLDPANADLDSLQAMLSPYPAEQMLAYPVSTIVNSPRNDNKACIAKV